MIKNYFIIAWRNMLKSKTFSIINITGLSIGMTVALLIGLWVYSELNYNHYHKNHAQLAGVWVTSDFDGKNQTGPAISIPLAAELKSKYGMHFKQLSLASWRWNHSISISKENIIQKEGMYVEANFPGMFSLEMIEGNVLTALSEPYSILLSESVAHSLFGEKKILGQTLHLDNEYQVKVTGVYKDLPFDSDFKRVEVLLPWLLHEKSSWVKDNLTNWKNHSWQLFAQIQDYQSMEIISQKIAKTELAFNQEGHPSVLLHPMDRWHLYGEFKDGQNAGGKILYVKLFSIIGIFVALLAVVNFINLTTARATKRAREVGVRKVIGSTKSQLVLQFLGESVLLGLLSMLLSIILIKFSLPAFNLLTGKRILLPFDNVEFWVSSALLLTIIVLLSGLYPAWYMSSLDALKVLKGGLLTGKSGSHLRKILITFQFTVSIALIVGTLVVGRQIEVSKNRASGYAKEKLMYTGVMSEMRGKYDILRNELFQTGVVEEMSQSSSPTTAVWSNESGFGWDGKDPNFNPSFGLLDCTHDFGKTIQWQIKEGRDFSRDFPSDSMAIILNESAVNLIGLKNIVGKMITYDDEQSYVIGVVKDIVMESPYEKVKPTIFRLDYKWVRVTNIRLKTGIPVNEATEKIGNVFKKLSPDNVYDFKFVSEEYNAKFESEERLGQLARVFSMLTIFIAYIGVFGLSIYVAEQRIKEIGIRKVLGSTVYNIIGLIAKDFLAMVVLATLLAVPISYYFMDRWLQQFSYRTGLSWWIFTTACTGTFIITILTVSVQAIKAALTNPVKSLRGE